MKISNVYSVITYRKKEQPCPFFLLLNPYLHLTLGLLQLNVDIFFSGCLVYQREVGWGRSPEWLSAGPQVGMGTFPAITGVWKGWTHSGPRLGSWSPCPAPGSAAVVCCIQEWCCSVTRRPGQGPLPTTNSQA